MLPASPHSLTVALLLLTATLPSCVTSELWFGDLPTKPVVAATTTTTARIDCAPIASSGLLLLPKVAGDGAREGWRLSAQGRSESSDSDNGGAETAAALLLVGGTFVVTHVTAEVRREIVDGEEQVATADVALTVVAKPAELARRLAPEELPEATRAALRSEAQRGHFLHSSVDLPTETETERALALHRCIAAMREADFATVLGRRATLVVVAVVAVDDRLQLVTAPRPETTNEAPTLSDTLHELAAARLVVELSDGQRRHHLLLRADEAWLWANLDRGRDGRCMHRSEWYAQPVTELLAPPPRWPGTLLVRDVQIEMRAPGIWERLRMTPFTLMVDLLLGWSESSGNRSTR